jgi:HEAT repeat protein
LLIAALADPVENVAESAAYALGHRHSPLAIPELLKLIDHSGVDFRRAAAHGLSCLDDRRATDGLIALCQDSDAYTRDWASFGLSEMCIIDYPDLRAELHRQLDDPNPEIRGQAMIGLARRGNHSCSTAVSKELRGDFHGIWAVNAAGHLGTPSLVNDLEDMRPKILADMGPDHYFLRDLETALNACRSSAPVAP